MAKDRIKKLQELREEVSRTERSKDLQELRDTFKAQWAKAHKKQEKCYDQRHEPLECQRGSLAKLSRTNLKPKDRLQAQRQISSSRTNRKLKDQFQAQGQISSSRTNCKLKGQISSSRKKLPISYAGPFHVIERIGTQAAWPYLTSTPAEPPMKR